MNKRKIFSILFSATILLSSYSNAATVSANSNSLSNLEQQQQKLEEQSSQLKETINDTEKEMNSLDSERQQLDEEISGLQQNIDDIIAQIREQEQEIDRLEEEINKLNKEIEALQEKIEQRNEILAEQARGVQVAGSPESVINLVLSAEGLSDLIGKMEVINVLVNNNSNIMEDQINDKMTVESNKKQVDQVKEETEQVKVEMEVNRNNLVSQKVELDSKVQLVTEKYNLTSEERNALVTEQQAIASKTDEINKQVQIEKDRVAAAAEAKREAETKAKEKAANPNPVKTASSNKAGVSAPVSTESTATPNSGGWVRPASGYVTSEFGMRKHPIFGTSKLHGGIDIGGGGPISAAQAGTVTVAGYHKSWGNHVKIDHGNGVSSLYAHMQSDLRVSVGQSVSGGQRVGTMGTTGLSTGVHLHFEVYENGNRVNPRNYVNF